MSTALQAALDAERRQAMSHSISTLLTRNLHDVFGENDPARRRAAIDEIFTEDCAFYEPRGVYRGRDEIERVAGAIKATHPDFRYQPICYYYNVVASFDRVLYGPAGVRALYRQKLRKYISTWTEGQ